MFDWVGIAGRVEGSVIEALALTWWLVVPLLLLVLLRDLWLWHVRVLALNKTEWTLLDIKIPAEVLKTPKAMEQVFSAVYSIYSYGTANEFFNKYWEGKMEKWMSFEMVGMRGGVYFFARIPKDARRLVESAVYSQFPNAEIAETSDYMELLPEALPNQTYDLWGTEMHLVRDSVYPIKTYYQFEEEVEERRIDPVGTIAEVMSNLREGEYILIQYIVSPTGKLTGEDLTGEAKKIVDELLTGKKPAAKPPAFLGWIESIGEFIVNLVKAPVSYPEWGVGGMGGEEKKPERSFMNVTKGVAKAIEAVENKAAQQIFKTTIRAIYIDRRDSFTPLNVAAIMGYFSQFNTYNLNAFKPKLTTYAKVWGRILPWWKKFRLTVIKREYFKRYRSRTFGRKNLLGKEKLPILSTEELATLYHFPITGVEAPSLRRLPSKTGEPPATLPVK